MSTVRNRPLWATTSCSPGVNVRSTFRWGPDRSRRTQVLPPSKEAVVAKNKGKKKDKKSKKKDKKKKGKKKKK